MIKVKINNKKIKILSIVSIVFFIVTNLMPAYALSYNGVNNNIQLDDVAHYNAVIFGDSNQVQGEVEGALAVRNNMNIEKEYTIGFSLSGAPNTMGDKEVDLTKPLFLLGGEVTTKDKFTIQSYNVMTNKKHNVNLVINENSKSEKVINKYDEENIHILKEDENIINTAFDNMKNEILSLIEDAKTFSDIIPLNDANNLKIGASKKNNRVLFSELEATTNNTLDINGIRISSLEDKDFLILYSDAEYINFRTSYMEFYNEDKKMYDILATSSPGDVNMSYICPKVLWVFPNAKEITNIYMTEQGEKSGLGLGGSIFAPEAVVKFKGGSINGQAYVSGFTQIGGSEIHNFAMNWSGWRNMKGKEASISFKKVDKDNPTLPLSGVKFELYKNDGLNGEEGTLIEENLTSGADGLVKTKSVPIGKYYFKEVSTLDGYTLLANRIPVDISNADDGQVINLNNIENEKTKVQVQIKKVDSKDSSIVLSEAEFKLWDAYNNKEVNQGKTYKTDENGLSEEITLTKGNYYFEEIASPTGYKLDNRKIAFNITGKETSKVIQNISNIKEDISEVGSLKITKVGNINGEKLEGVKFNLLDSNTENASILDTLTTDSKGVVIKNNLPVGKYYLQEIETKAGYRLNSEYIGINITAENLDTEKVIVNEFIPGQVILVKEDIDTGELKANAYFKLYDERNNELGQYKTNENGMSLIRNLRPGKYHFIETKAPYGYDIDQTPIYFEIRLGATEPSKAVSRNKIKLGKVRLMKIDSENGKVLEGAKFKLLDKEGKEVDVYTTNNEGVIEVNSLRPGKYSFLENKAPNGYEKSTTPINFEIVLGETEAKLLVVKNTKLEKDGSEENSKNDEEEENNSNKTDEERIAEEVKTGDEAGLIEGILFLLASIALGFVFIARKR